jgi:hypothetical protein
VTVTWAVADCGPQVCSKIGHGLIRPAPSPLLAIADIAEAADPGAA